MQILKIGDFYRGTVDRAFDAQNVPPPVILFDPQDSAMGSGHLQLFARISDRKATRPGGAIPRSAFRLEDYGSMADFMAVVERKDAPVAERQGWTFAYSGAEIDFAQTEILSGQPVSCLSSSSATLMSEVWNHAARDHGARALTVHSSPREMLQSDWTVLSIPLLAEVGSSLRVDGFVLYARASNLFSAGLDAVPDPVVIVDADRTVCMVNEAARHVFGAAEGSGTQAPTLVEYTHSDLELSNFNSSGHLTGRRLRKHCRCLLNGVITPMDASIAMMRHRGKDYMVVSLRPAV